jgi:outer membrane protein assembly factor BamD (BamD/ComL family)
MKKMRFAITTAVAMMVVCVIKAQPGAQIEVQKPKKYENRKLPSEKTGEKKFTIPRKLYQNTVTHYNYYFNANNRLNEIVASAKTAFKDDYSQLLPFYNYSLDVTAQSKSDLDSVVYKCTAGILLHDLRNSWIDNMYLLLAKAYLLRKDFDSSELTLQYLNFSYAPKEKEGNYDIPIGSNASNDKGEFSIATREKNSIWTKLTSRPPSRNESFLWQIRAHIEKDELPEASGIIEILRHDPNFPARLQTRLHESIAYWYYKQQAYDSAASHLAKALDEAANKQERARWEYLIAQMYQLAKKNENAVDFYNRCISHTADPVMDIYARLNSIRIKRNDKTDYIQENINALLKMAKRDKYESYRDIIYFAMAKIELERNSFNNAQDDLFKSVKFSTNNPAQRSQSFLLLADINYNHQYFPESYNFYDSLDVNSLTAAADKERVLFRKPPLLKIAENTLLITRQDSLQALAKLPAAQRDAIVKKQVKLLRKQLGLKEEDPGSTNTAVKQVPDLFANNEKSNDFYFYNASQKARGFSEFKARWGERPNEDNWRRKSALDRQSQSISDVEDTATVRGTFDEQKATDNSYEGLQQNIPLTSEKLEESNKSIMNALITLGQTFVSPLEEYPAAIKAYEELLRRFPNTPNKQEAWFNLIYAYQKTGDKSKSAEYKNLLLHDNAQSKWSDLIKNPALAKNDLQNAPATKKYEEIYNLFIEGKFDEAKRQKKLADSLYGSTHWTPQLLYIESVYYIKQQEDNTAIKVLTDLSDMFADNPIAEKAKTMIDVLRRRKEIVAYLTKLNVTRKEDGPVSAGDQPVKNTTAPVENDTATSPPVVTTTNTAETENNTTAKNNEPEATEDTAAASAPEPVANDTATAQPDNNAIAKNDQPEVAGDTAAASVPEPVTSDTATAEPEDNAIAKNDMPEATEDTVAASIPEQVTSDTATEEPGDNAIAKNDQPEAKQDTVAASLPPPVSKDTAPVSKDNALAKNTRPQNNPSAVKKDTVPASKPAPVSKDTAVTKNNTPAKINPPVAKKDTVPASRPAPVTLKEFSFVATDSQYVVILLDKVDRVYASEAGNAFNRFNRERYNNQKINVNNLQLNDRYNLVLQGPFADANAAVDYVDKVRPIAKSRILPWLTADKYSFLVMSNANLQLLQSGKDMETYKQLLQKAYPGKF